MAPDNQTYYNYSLIALAAVIWFALYQLFSFVMTLGFIQTYVAPSETARAIIPFVLGLAGAAGAYYGVIRNEAANRFGMEVVVELRKVVWPTRAEIRSTTTAVLIFLIIIATILFIFDRVLGKILMWLIA